jgi:hypothetical protein
MDIMKKLTLPVALALGVLAAAAAEADIYRWKDAKGLTHFTNEPPPPGAVLVERIEEVPYDAEADRRRIEEERRMHLERQRLEVEEKKAALEQREREVRMKLDEADRALRQAREAEEKPSESAGRDCSEEYFLRFGTCAGYPRVIHRTLRPSGQQDLYRGYTRKEGGLYYRQPPPPPPKPAPPPIEPKPPKSKTPPPADRREGKAAAAPPKAPAKTPPPEAPPDE